MSGGYQVPSGGGYVRGGGGVVGMSGRHVICNCNVCATHSQHLSYGHFNFHSQ